MAHPQRDSNPCRHLERVVSLAARRWGRVKMRLSSITTAPKLTAGEPALRGCHELERDPSSSTCLRFTKRKPYSSMGCTTTYAISKP